MALQEYRRKGECPDQRGRAVTSKTQGGRRPRIPRCLPSRSRASTTPTTPRSKSPPSGTGVGLSAEVFRTASGGWTLHQLRHSRRTHLAEAGVAGPLLMAAREDQPMAVVIGVDPHKHLNAVVVLSAKGSRRVDNTTEGFKALLALGRQWRERVLAIEGCNGVGKHISQRLLVAGERVFDVSTRRAALVRVYAGGNGRKNDDKELVATIPPPTTAPPPLTEARPGTRTRP